MEKKLRIALYSPYVPEHEGGGERYFFSVAEILSQSHDVFVLFRGTANPSELGPKYEKKFHLDLSRVKFVPTKIGTGASFLQKLFETLQYDVMYYVTDGSFFFSLARKNIMHIQFPFRFSITGTVNHLKLANWTVRNANSQFTQRVVSTAWQVPVQFVHYPYVESEIFQPLEKEKIILSVGRFFTGEKSGMHCKRQDVLVRAFVSMCVKKLAPGWKLVLVGTVDPGKDNEEYAKNVAKLARGYPIKILHDASFDVLQKYYAHSSIYWHAAGFGIDEEKEPTKVEHFGISTLEAMSSGGVPVVVGKGGQPEIVEDGRSGFLWQTEDELIEKTRELLLRPELMQDLQLAARARALTFNKQRFAQTLEEMLR